MKRIVLFFMVSLFLIALSEVDDSCSSMMGLESHLSLQTRRIDQDHVRFSLLGKEREANMKEIEQAAEEVRDQAVAVLEQGAGRIREWLGFGVWPRKDLPFEAKVL